MDPTRWDVQLFVRAAALAVLALGLAWLVTAATDEVGISWGEHAGRTLPLAPVCAGFGAWLALTPACARGEALALAALGRARIQVAGAAVAGGAALALVVALAIEAAPAIDVSAFFPRATRLSAWVWQNGMFVDRVRGLQVGPDGAPVWLSPESPGAAAATPTHGRAAAALITAFAGLALPLVMAHALLVRAPDRTRAGGPRRVVGDASAILVSCGAAAASVILLQLAAAGRVPALLATAPPGALLVFAARQFWISP